MGGVFEIVEIVKSPENIARGGCNSAAGTMVLEIRPNFCGAA